MSQNTLKENQLITIMTIIVCLCLTGGLLVSQYMTNKLKSQAINKGCSVSKDMTIICQGTKL